MWAEAEREQRRHEQDPAAHAEQPGEDTGEQPDKRGEDLGHETKSQTATPTRSAAKR